ncbi:MAG: hypothetical protein JWQ63_1671 [Mucilaginibacter sp.]|nr:hypothetical protein [Mucilaginibacter sp.]
MTLSQTINKFLDAGDYVSARRMVKSELAKLENLTRDDKIIEQSKF